MSILSCTTYCLMIYITLLCEVCKCVCHYVLCVLIFAQASKNAQIPLQAFRQHT